MFEGKEIKPLFLLGGYDLEMLTIKNILESVSARYVDYALRWNEACLSRFEDVFQRYSQFVSYFYGIELREDIPLPEHYIRIDHHNEYAHLPSALEQIMGLFGLPLTRRLSLIAANDKAYIPGMLQLGATAEEIASIRQADREAQGVTEKDEYLAEKAVRENKEIVKDLIVIRALSSRFSPICDRLYPYKRLLIYTDKEWMYYGEQAYVIKEYFESFFLKGYMFNGGGDNGYLGSRQDVYTSDEIHEMVQQIKKLMSYGI